MTQRHKGQNSQITFNTSNSLESPDFAGWLAARVGPWRQHVVDGVDVVVVVVVVVAYRQMRIERSSKMPVQHNCR
jgi:hypothetical protein